MSLIDFFGFSQATAIKRIRRWLRLTRFHNISLTTLKCHYQNHAQSRITTTVLREALEAEGYTIVNGRVKRTQRGQNDRYSTSVCDLWQGDTGE